MNAIRRFRREIRRTNRKLDRIERRLGISATPLCDTGGVGNASTSPTPAEDLSRRSTT